MLVDEEDLKILRIAEDLTNTDYGIIGLGNGYYLIHHNNMLVLIEDLIDKYNYLKEEADNK